MQPTFVFLDVPQRWHFTNVAGTPGGSSGSQFNTHTDPLHFCLRGTLKLELREVTLLFRRFPPFFVVFPCSACLPPLLSTNFPAIPFELSTISPFPAFCLFAPLISVQPPGFFTRIPGISRFPQI